MAAAAKQTKTVKQPAPKPAKPKHTADDSDNAKSKVSTKSSTASSKSQQPSASQSTANAQSAQDGSSPDDAATASEANAFAGNAKNRAPLRTTPKNAGAQDAARKNAEDAATDPSADNQSGLSLIQLLAKSLQSDDSDTTATADATDPTSTDQPNSAGGTDKTSDDPNAIALAMFSQSLAAALASQSAAAPANTGEATTSISSATESPGGPAAMRDLMTVLAQDVAADAKGKSDDGAAQFNVDTTKGATNEASNTDANAVSPDGLSANGLTHLGVASHFAAQHLRNETNTADLKSPVGSSAWEDEIGTHLTWMTQKGLETGSLRVSPEHLGPVEVNISVQNGDASVWFAANHPDTRAALEQALPRLREMFANQGMNLADSGVSRQSLSQQGSRNQSRSAASQSISGVSAVDASDGSSSASARLNLGLVDLYA